MKIYDEKEIIYKNIFEVIDKNEIPKDCFAVNDKILKDEATRNIGVLCISNITGKYFLYLNRIIKPVDEDFSKQNDLRYKNNEIITEI